MKLATAFLILFYSGFDYVWGFGASQWTYENQETWIAYCKRGFQSPINLECKTSEIDNNPPPSFSPEYLNPMKILVVNVGNLKTGFFDNFERKKNNKWLTISNGEKYLLFNGLFHWPSEHTVNGRHCDLDLQLYHIADKYRTQSDADKQQDGWKVLTICFKISDTPNPFFDPIIEKVPAIADPRKRFQYTEEVDIGLILNRRETNFFTYNGTTTVPDCHRAVMWLIYTKPHPISNDQFDKLTNILNDKKERANATNRHIQDLYKNITVTFTGKKKCCRGNMFIKKRCC